VKRLILTYLILVLTIATGLSQMLTIVDVEDNKPIPDVAILNMTRTMFIYSSKSGKADISEYKEEGTICFQHFTYEAKCMSYEELSMSGFVVKMTKKIFLINEFVIAANRWEQKADEVPNKISALLKPLIEFQNPQTTADLIGMTDEVYIQKSQLGGGSPMIRGFATNRVLIVVDGVRMNNAIYREGNIQNVLSLDPSAMESAEVIFGPGAIVYGSDAIGGIMDFHTKKAMLSTGDNAYIKSDAFIRFSSANREKSFHFDFNAGRKKIAFLTSASWTGYEDLKMGSHSNTDYLRPEYVKRFDDKDSVVSNPDPRVQVYSGYSQLNIMNKLRIKPGKNVDLVYSNHYSRLSDVPRYDRLIQYKSGKLRYGEWYYGPQEWMMNSLQATINTENGIFDELRLIVAHQSYMESRHDRSFNKADINEQTEKLSIISLNLDFSKNLKSEKELVYYGFEYVNNDIRSVAQIRNIITGDILPAGSRYPNGKNKYASASLYGGYKNSITENLVLNTGIRYNYVTLNSTIADNTFYSFPFSTISISNSAFTGSAGAVLKVNDKLDLHLNLSTGFRAPNLDDAGKVFDSAPGIVVVPNPDLEPEYAWNIDFAILKDFGQIIHAEFSPFFTLLKNAMVRHDFLFNNRDSIEYLGELSKVEAVTNAGSAYVSGFQFNLQVNISEKISLKSSLNFTEGYEEDKIPLRHAAPLFGSTHLLFEHEGFKADLYSTYNGAKKFKKMALSEIEKPYLYAVDENGNPWAPGWITLNFKATYGIKNRYYINAGVENILDLRYRPYSSGIAAPGRNYIISLRLAL
jgi:hemoglobin/transferrin/lactoferrin receptor protein